MQSKRERERERERERTLGTSLGYSVFNGNENVKNAIEVWLY